ncbi:hypothetical protein ATANTOWER_011778 [Ataeniobius toweri]|uniref:Uncharacterized protein n=1 Tax=Ataeniobius toweri TaxID=208326 RepID=A0ABU7AEL4_9TELE|nr:hypothetical protein [Ataeniobius toweri]
MHMMKTLPYRGGEEMPHLLVRFLSSDQAVCRVKLAGRNTSAVRTVLQKGWQLPPSCSLLGVIISPLGGWWVRRRK